jgi:hypothetical protein
MLSDKATNIKREEVMAWFGGRQQLIETHLAMTQYYYDCDTAIDEE